MGTENGTICGKIGSYSAGMPFTRRALLGGLLAAPLTAQTVRSAHYA
jgi:hypothetical protein